MRAHKNKWPNERLLLSETTLTSLPHSLLVGGPMSLSFGPPVYHICCGRIAIVDAAGMREYAVVADSSINAKLGGGVVSLGYHCHEPLATSDMVAALTRSRQDKHRIRRED